MEENVCSYQFAAQAAQHVAEDVEEKPEEGLRNLNLFAKFGEHGEDSSKYFLHMSTYFIIINKFRLTIDNLKMIFKKWLEEITK